jgi:hypothetical protein
VKIFELRNQEWMPYALAQVEEAPWPEVWLPTNRDYERPEGMRWDYSAHMDRALVFRESPRLLVDCFVGDLTGRYLFLFDHTSDDAEGYRARLASLWALHGDAWEFFHEKRKQ